MRGRAGCHIGAVQPGLLRAVFGKNPGLTFRDLAVFIRIAKLDCAIESSVGPGHDVPAMLEDNWDFELGGALVPVVFTRRLAQSFIENASSGVVFEFDFSAFGIAHDGGFMSHTACEDKRTGSTCGQGP